MRSVAYYRHYEGINIWMKSEVFIDDIEADFIIAHSSGVYAALKNCKLKDKTKFILVNPLVHDLRLLKIFSSWLKYMLHEFYRDTEFIGFRNLFFAIRKFFILSKSNFLDLSKEITKENVFIIRGEKDNYFCDNRAVSILIENNFSIINIPEAGHSWSEKFDEKIKEIINI